MNTSIVVTRSDLLVFFFSCTRVRTRVHEYSSTSTSTSFCFVAALRKNVALSVWIFLVISRNTNLYSGFVDCRNHSIRKWPMTTHSHYTYSEYYFLYFLIRAAKLQWPIFPIEHRRQLQRLVLEWTIPIWIRSQSTKWQRPPEVVMAPAQAEPKGQQLMSDEDLDAVGTFGRILSLVASYYQCICIGTTR